jgi:hypothetical protein
MERAQVALAGARTRLEVQDGRLQIITEEWGGDASSA